MSIETSSTDERLPRGTIKSFREYLNEWDRKRQAQGGQKYRHYRYRQLKRLYGDYLYFQDRVMFDQELAIALSGEQSYSDWKRP